MQTRLRTLAFRLKEILRYTLNPRSAPRAVYIEPTNICNANCIFCAYQYDPTPKATLSLPLFKKALHEHHEMKGDHIGLTPRVGEIFADRTVLEKLAAVREKGFQRVHTYTNATLIHRFGVENILRSGLTELRISTAPLDKNLYEKIYRNSQYPQLLRNLQDLVKAFRDLPHKTVTQLSIEFRAERSFDECLKLPDFQEWILPHLSAGVTLHSRSTYDSWNGAIRQEDLLEGMQLLTRKPEGKNLWPCSRIYNLKVLADGRIQQCGCIMNLKDEKDDLILGNIADLTLQEAFHSQKAKANVRGFLKGLPPNTCRGCSWYTPDPMLLA